MKILLNGIGGRMGKEVTRRALDGYKETTLVCGVDGFGADAPVPCYKSFTEVTEDVDCVIDFSHHSLTAPLLAFCKQKKLPVVIATTGQTEEEKAKIRAAAAEIPVFFSGNMSIGIALLISLAKKAASVFPDADVEIVETHHNRKLDVPSGTALMIAEGIREARGTGELCIGRHENGKRPEGEIGIHSLRLGNVVGEHEIRINTGTQTITLKHEAHSRALFAEGALTAAAFLIEQENGLFNVNDLFG